MAVYSVAPKTGRVKAAGEVSPRVMIVTDAARVESVPASVRSAADLISTEDSGLFQEKPADANANANGFLTWLEGDELVQGCSEDLRGVFLSRDPVNYLVPVHLPCLAEGGPDRTAAANDRVWSEQGDR